MTIEKTTKHIESLTKQLKKLESKIRNYKLEYASLGHQIDNVQNEAALLEIEIRKEGHTREWQAREALTNERIKYYEDQGYPHEESILKTRQDILKRVGLS